MATQSTSMAAYDLLADLHQWRLGYHPARCATKGMEPTVASDAANLINRAATIIDSLLMEDEVLAQFKDVAALNQPPHKEHGQAGDLPPSSSELLQAEARIYNDPGQYRVLVMEGTGSRFNNADVASLLRKLAAWIESQSNAALSAFTQTPPATANDSLGLPRAAQMPTPVTGWFTVERPPEPNREPMPPSSIALL